MMRHWSGHDGKGWTERNREGRPVTICQHCAPDRLRFAVVSGHCAEHVRLAHPDAPVIVRDVIVAQEVEP